MCFRWKNGIFCVLWQSDLKQISTKFKHRVLEKKAANKSSFCVLGQNDLNHFHKIIFLFGGALTERVLIWHVRLREILQLSFSACIFSHDSSVSWLINRCMTVNELKQRKSTHFYSSCILHECIYTCSDTVGWSKKLCLIIALNSFPQTKIPRPSQSAVANYSGCSHVGFLSRDWACHKSVSHTYDIKFGSRTGIETLT